MNKLCLIFCILITFKIQAKEIILTADSLSAVLTKDWKFSPDDNYEMARSNYNDSSWSTQSPIIGIDESHFGFFKGFGWFRYRFLIDSSLVNIPLAISMEQPGASEIYLDGKLIIKYGIINGIDSSVYFNPIKTPQIIYLTNIGEHVLAVRYANYNLGENYNSGFRLVIGKAENLIAQKETNAVAITFITVSLGFIFLTLSLLHLFFFLYYRSIISNLFFSIFMFSVSSLFFLLFIGSLVHNPLMVLKLRTITFLFICLTCISFTYFIHYLFSKKTKFWLRLIFLFNVFMLISLYWIKNIFPVVITSLIIGVCFYGLFSIAFAIYQKVKGAWIIGAGILFFILFLLTVISFAIINGDFELNDSTLLGKILLLACILAVVSIPLSMSIYQAWGFSELNKDLTKQLIQVKYLSAITLKQEQEKKAILENQKSVLEIKVEERTTELKIEKKKSDDLLLNILPSEVADELKAKGSADAKQFDDVTVMFTDFKGFTQISEKLSPTELVNEIHTCFKAFDNIISKHNIEKIKTIGDSYMCAGGLPVMNKTNATDIVCAAMEIQSFMQQHSAKRKSEGKEIFEIRIGIHTGPVVAGIVGVKKFAYDIWGDTVNIASRMESSGETGKVNISGSTFELVKDKFTCTHRGKIQAKNKGEIDMYFVESRLVLNSQKN
ncbi:hypothetical protein LBMAG27_01690 [Bacteroidota bacterium]|nr:hypothetical protein LBMAG27_01690 [Bacteroidota bacterium]